MVSSWFGMIDLIYSTSREQKEIRVVPLLLVRWVVWCGEQWHIYRVPPNSTIREVLKCFHQGGVTV
jgi:hypothetical protein